MASLGLAQLRRYPEMLRRRRELIERYDAALADKPVTARSHYGPDFSFQRASVSDEPDRQGTQGADAFIIRLAEREIAANVHYKPLPLHTAYRKLGFRPEEYPHAVGLFETRLLCRLTPALPTIWRSICFRR